MIIGIDLGTTNSLVAHFTEDGPVLIPNALGETLTPSAVYVDKNNEVTVGQAAKDRLVTDGDASVARFKRRMGTTQASQLRKQKFRPEDLSALVLKALKADAEAHLGTKVKEAVISVPAYFNDIQRKATIAAAELAGLSVRRLVNEPTAAALAYGLHRKESEDTFLVVDLGGGTFDVTILEMFSGVMEVRASAGDAFLGGEDFTDRVFDHFADQLNVQTQDLSTGEIGRLRGLADKAKHELTENVLSEVMYRHGETEVPLSLSRSKFEEITESLVARVRRPIQRAISDANLKADDIDRIVLVGGATRMSVLRNLITKLFNRFPEHELDPDRIVALGAAVQAGLLERHEALEDVVMTDVCPFTLGYETARELEGKDNWEHGIFSPLIERNTVVPVSRSQAICPLQPGQKKIDLKVYQGEAIHVRDNIKIGQLAVPIPYNRKDREEVDLRFTYDNSGVLEVLAKVMSTGKQLRLIIEGNPGALSSAEINKRFKELERIKVHPRDEAQNAALIARLSAAFENLLGDRRAYVSDLLSRFESTLASHDKREIEQLRQEITEQLNHLERDDAFH